MTLPISRVVRLVIACLLAGAGASAGAVVFTTDFDRVTVLPALPAGSGDVDWRTKGAVNLVKNEGACDASWAFAVTGMVEGYHQIQGFALPNLSEQELLDCTDMGSGCSGGSPIAALRTVIARGGLASTATYPYTSIQGTCKANVAAVATIPGAGRVPPGDEASLAAYVAQGPVVALIDASQPSFANYKSGVYSEPACSSDNPTRAVLIVGYLSDRWIVKNSLGTSWGSQGYIFMSRNNNNNCGIASFALAISNNALPPPVGPATPALSRLALGLLLLSLAALGFVKLRERDG